MHPFSLMYPSLVIFLIALASMSWAVADPAAKAESDKNSVNNALAALKFPGLKVNAELHCVDVDATICLDEGALELVACTKDTKEHESLVVVDARPMHIHAALLLLGAKNGSPASRRVINEETHAWQDCPPHGDLIEVLLVVKNAEGKMIEHSISDFITHMDDGDPSVGAEKKEGNKAEKFPSTFLFAGSLLIEEGNTPRKYLADSSGSVISISTFGDELLCLPGMQSQENGALAWQINAKGVTKKGDKVTLRLRPKKTTPKQ